MATELLENLKDELCFENVELEDFKRLISTDFEIALPYIQMVISELCRYAMNDLFSRTDGQGDTNSPFHTRSFHIWVEQKLRSRLLPLGIDESIIRRSILCTLGMDYKPEEDDWKKRDQYNYSYLEIGELFRIGRARNLPAPDRYIELNDLIYIISSRTTAQLYRDFQQLGVEFRIEHIGMMRILRTQEPENLLNGWSKQAMENYLSIPSVIHEVLSDFESELSDKRKKFIGLLNQFRHISLTDYCNAESDSEMILTYARREKLSFRYSFDIPIPNEAIQTVCSYQHRLVRQEQQYSSNSYFFTHHPGEIATGRRADFHGMNLYFISSREAPYILRLFDDSDHKATLTIRKEGTINLSKHPPASGRRMLMMFGCKRVLEGDRFKGSYSLLYPDDRSELTELFRKWNLYTVVAE